MGIAGHNMQHELKDVNNLWIWPSDFRSAYQSKESIFKPEFNVWFQASDVGFISNVSESQCIHFTGRSVSSRRVSGYQGATFLNFRTGNYTMSFFSDIECQISFVAYVWQDAERVKYGNIHMKDAHFDAGLNQFEFEIKDGILPLMCFYGDPEG